jgi:type I restriction enzyme S subunit
MSLPGYERYRDSGEVWLGQVPEHWQVKRLRHLANVQSGVAKGRDLAGRETIQVPYLRVANVQDGYLDLDEITMIDIEPRELDRYALRPGDVLMNEGGDFDKLGRGHVWRGEIDNCIHQNHVFAVRPYGIEPEWLTLVTSAISSRSFFISRSKQSTNLASISLSNLQELPLCVPPRAERHAIAAFLDRETAKIDALVDEQRRLIELLKEKRQAVISHAVTKGLDPDAPMQNSGVEWLGQVPEHWEVKRLKHISPEITVGIVVEPSKYYADDGVPALRSLNVKPGAISTDGLVYISEQANDQLEKSKLHSGDLIVVRSGQPGTTAIVPPELDGCNCIDLIIIRKPLIDSEQYLCWYLASDIARRQFAEGSGGAIQQHFNIGTAANLLLAVPPPNEQHAIAGRLDVETKKIDLLIDEAEIGISFLMERRTALISAAVTGKIDVRGAAPAAAEAA